jgi:Cellulase N-terminal ig-like domain
VQHLLCALVRDSPAAAAIVVLVLVNAISTVASAAPDPGPVVKVNQVAYVPGLPKQATVVSNSSSPLAWTLRNSAGATVATGLTTIRGLDSRSGDNVHMVDFSPFDTVGRGLCAVGRQGQQLSVRHLCRCHKKAPVRCVGILLPPT